MEENSFKNLVSTPQNVSQNFAVDPIGINLISKLIIFLTISFEHSKLIWNYTKIFKHQIHIII